MTRLNEALTFNLTQSAFWHALLKTNKKVNHMFKHFALCLMLVCFLGCGTDVKPNYFIGMFRDEGDIDRLASCLSAIPETDDEGNIIIKANSQCLIDLSSRDTSDPNMDMSFSEILNDPETYMDRLLTFEAVVKKVDHNNSPELYTNRKDRQFYLNTHGAPLFYIDEEGEEQDILPHSKYMFKCRIYEIKIETSGVWRIHAEFIVREDNQKTIIFPPVPVQDEGPVQDE